MATERSTLALVGFFFGPNWRDQIGSFSNDVLAELAPFCSEMPKGRLTACIRTRNSRGVVMPTSWRRNRQMSYVYERLGVHINELVESDLSEVQGKGLSVGYEAKQRGAVNHQLTQPFVLGFEDGIPSRQELAGEHPWEGGVAEPSVELVVRADFVRLNASSSSLHGAVARVVAGVPSTFFGFVDTFSMKDVLGGLAFKRAFSLPVDVAINDMMEDWHEPMTNRRQVIPAVFWGNLWGAELIERLGVPAPDFVRKSLATIKSDWIKPIFTDCGSGRVFWTFTEGGLADVMEHRGRLPELLDAKRRVTRALVERGVTLNKRPWVGPRLAEDTE